MPRIASSVYSLKLACDYLNTGKGIDMMLAGAVSGADPFFINMGFPSSTLTQTTVFRFRLIATVKVCLLAKVPVF
ncbi:hypothetical protein O9992_14565 [Vibrio lentus]|nr:hypothetical protein [Vibrio lentus]